MNDRALAVKCLLKVLVDKKPLTFRPREQQAISNQNPSPIVKEFCFGVLRNYYFLDAVLKKLLGKPLKQKDTDIYLLLLLGIYQIYRLDIPHHAVVNETVAAAKNLKKKWAKPLINAVLRTFIRQQSALLDEVNQQEEVDFLHPHWMIKKLKAAWSGDWEQILQANLTRAPMTLRVNTQKISRETYLQLLDEKAISGVLTKHSPYGIILNTPCMVSELPLFTEGMVSVQDEAAQLVAPLLDLSPELSVLDACAAPGGKTGHIWELMPELSSLVALDNVPERMALLEETRQRLNAAIETQVVDFCAPCEGLGQRMFDRILLDVPCSGTGVIRRHPDIKLLRTPEDIEDLIEKQALLLAQAWHYLKPGGFVIYTTCSIFPEENEQQIEQFLSLNPDASSEPLHFEIGHKQQHGWQILPQLMECSPDGFYYAKLHKRAS